MPDVPIRWELQVIRPSRAPLAITLDGEVVLSFLELDVEPETDEIIAALRRERGRVFVGVVLSSREVKRLVREVDLVLPNALLPILGGRLRPGRP